MVINFSNIDYNERPILILKNAGGTPLGVLGYANLITPNISYNETSVIEFSIPACVDGVDVPFYDDVVGMRVVELMNIGQFTLVNPVETGDGIKRIKACKGYSLEYEFARKKITLEAGTFKFWDVATTENTLLGRIMELMPSWEVGDVSTSLLTRYRTFEAKSDNLYNFIKSSAQKSFGCIFTFDTIKRLVHVRDADEIPSDTGVYLSHENLAKEIVLEENTEDIFTRLDVSGAEGVNIRDVNPAGTNQLINLDYYMTPRNFDQALIDKYFAWKELFSSNKRSYYLLSVQYSLKLSQRESEQAKLTDLNGELSSLENLQAIAIQAIAQGLGGQEDLDKANADIAAKQAEIDAQQAVIDAVQAEADTIFDQIKVIRDSCNFESYFTKEEYKQLDRYMNDTEVADPSFAITTTNTYTQTPTGTAVTALPITISDCKVEPVTDAVGTVILDITSGSLVIGDAIQSSVISAVVEIRNRTDIVATIYSGEGTHSGTSYPSGCITLTGTAASIVSDSTDVFSCSLTGYMYFTLDATEYEKRNIAWELFEYGDNLLNKVSKPSYTFKITSANFFSIEEFEAFKNALRLGERIYIRISEDSVLTPILIGVKFEYDQPDSIELTFSDSFASGDSAFRLVDLLEQSVSMGKNLDVSKYVYSAFSDSGAETGIKTFMNSALDVSKNAIISSTDQAVSWDGAGIRLRRYANEAKTAYEDEQIWMNNNSILMTDDGWTTAKMAIGKFHDESLGDCWGIVADRIVGTLIAGSNMIIESEKKDGGTAVFRMDSDGCRLYNSDFSLMSGTNQIALNPDIGFAIGKFPIYMEQARSSSLVLNEENCTFWVDPDGNVHIKGTLHGVDGEFSGELRCVSADGSYFRVDGTAMGFYTEDNSPMLDYADGVMTLYGAIQAKGPDGGKFYVTNNQMGFYDADGNPLLYYQGGNLTMTGAVNATELNIVDSNGSSSIDAYIGNHEDVKASIEGVERIGNDLNEFKLEVSPDAIITEIKNSNTFASGDELDALEVRVSSAEQKITPDAIVTTVTTSNAYTTLQTTVTQTANGLESKVDKNGVISSINQSAETVEINAEKIKLEGTVTANGYFKVLTDGSVEAVNGKFSGTFTAGNWTFDSSGAKYLASNGSTLNITADGYTAYYHTDGMQSIYGSDDDHTTIVKGESIAFQMQNGDDSYQYDCVRICNSRTYNESLGKIEYAEPTIIAEVDGKGGDGWDYACGNIGTRTRRWDIAWLDYINSSASVHVSSSRDVKHNITPLESMGDILDHLTPVSFVYNWNPDTKISYGLIMEDTVEYLPVICETGEDPRFEKSISYEMLIPVLLKEIQDLRKRVAAIEA